MSPSGRRIVFLSQTALCWAALAAAPFTASAGHAATRPATAPGSPAAGSAAAAGGPAARSAQPAGPAQGAAQPASPGQTPALAPPTPEQKQQAGAEVQAGQAADKAGDYDQAIAHYQKAFEIYPDPLLQLLIGESHRKKGEAALSNSDWDTAVSEFQAANAAYQKYLELVPQGKEADAARQRITALEQGIANARKGKQQAATQAADKARQEQEARRAAEEKQRQEAAANNGTQFALDGQLIAGVDQDWARWRG